MKANLNAPKGIPHNRIRKRTKMSSTPGSTKPRCVASSLMRYVAKHNRSYKISEYDAICEIWRKRN